MTERYSDGQKDPSKLSFKVHEVAGIKTVVEIDTAHIPVRPADPYEAAYEKSTEELLPPTQEEQK
jgi:hypothetical protein